VGIVAAGAIESYWPIQMTQRVVGAAWNGTSPREIVRMFDKGIGLGVALGGDVGLGTLSPRVRDLAVARLR